MRWSSCSRSGRPPPRAAASCCVAPPARAVRPDPRPTRLRLLDWALPTGVLVAVLACSWASSSSCCSARTTTSCDHRPHLRRVRPQRVLAAARRDGARARGARPRVPVGPRPHTGRARRQAGSARRAGAAHPRRRRVGDQPHVALPAGVRVHRAAAARADLRAVAGRGLPPGADRRAAAAAGRALATDGGRRDARPARPGRARRGAVHRRAQRGAVVGDRQARHLLPRHLSADAVPALVDLPPAVRDCILVDIGDGLATPDDWRSTNVAREAARAALDGLDPACIRGSEVSPASATPLHHRRGA